MLEIVGSEGGTDEHLSGTLGMANVGDRFLACFSEDVVDEGRLVVEAHLLEVEIPVLALAGCVGGVTLRVEVASVVTHPDVKASTLQDKSGCDVGGVEDPLHSAVLDSVLKEDYRSSRYDWLDSLKSIDIAINSCYIELLIFKAIFFNDLLDIVISVVEFS